MDKSQVIIIIIIIIIIIVIIIIECQQTDFIGILSRNRKPVEFFQRESVNMS